MTTTEPTGILATINTQPAEQTLAQLTALHSIAERERLATADAAIDAHACDLGPEDCEECDRLWSQRADAHDEPTYQLALDPEALAREGAQHITAVGDSAPLCEVGPWRTLTDWSEPMTEDALGHYLVAPNHAICGKCADEFWGDRA